MICFTETSGNPITASIFSKRNSTTRASEVYVVCAMSDGAVTTLQWFAVRSISLVELTSPWPLLHTPARLLVFSAAGHTKLLAFNAWQPQHPHNTADVYDFKLDTSVDLWLSHKIQLEQADSAAISYVGEQVYLSVSQGRKQVNLYEFKDQKFELISQIPSEGVKEIIAFDIGSTSFLAVSGSVPRVLRVPPNNRDVDGLHFTNSSVVRRWLAVPVNTYRDEVLLLAETERGVEMVTWSAPAHFAVDTRRPPHCVMEDHEPRRAW